MDKSTEKFRLEGTKRESRKKTALQMLFNQAYVGESRQKKVKLFARHGKIVRQTSLSTRFTPSLSDLRHVFVVAEALIES